MLSGSPEPFAVDNREKRGALSHFQPPGVLVSHGQLRVDRREVNDAVLDSHRPVHRLAEAITAKVVDEAQPLVPDGSSGSLAWDEFATTWWRAVRRVVLGDAARDDHELTDLLARLRADANWSSLHPKRTRVRARFLQRLRAYLDEPEPSSLADLVASTPSPAETDPGGQVPQWSDRRGDCQGGSVAVAADHNDVGVDEGGRVAVVVPDRPARAPGTGGRPWPSRDRCGSASWRPLEAVAGQGESPASITGIQFQPARSTAAAPVLRTNAYSPLRLRQSSPAGSWPARCASSGLMVLEPDALAAVGRHI